MEQALYPGKTELSDDEHTEVAWALEDGALFARYNGDVRKLTDTLAPAVIDELSGDLYVLAAPEALMQHLKEIFE